MSSNLVFHILAFILLSINPTSNAFPALDEFVIPDVVGASIPQQISFTEAIPSKGFSSKVRSFLGNPFKGLFKPKEEFVIAEAEPKQFNIDPRFLKVASSAVGALFPVAKSSASAGIGAAVGAPVGAVMGAKAGAVKGAQVGKAFAKQKVEISKKIGEVASELLPKSMEASVKIQHPVVGKQFGRIELDWNQNSTNLIKLKGNNQ